MGFAKNMAQKKKAAQKDDYSLLNLFYDSDFRLFV